MQEFDPTPDHSLKLLEEGNFRYVTESRLHPNQCSVRRSITASQGQQPFATVLACSDSRVPVEIIFDRGIGDIFVVRVAGNVLGGSELGSVEYSVDRLRVPLVVVLGHTGCGAVTAVVQEGLLSGNLRGLSEKILPAVEKARHSHPGLNSDQLVPEAVKANVFAVVEETLASSRSIKTKSESGQVKVIGAIYDSRSGHVEWLEP